MEMISVNENADSLYIVPLCYRIIFSGKAAIFISYDGSSPRSKKDFESKILFFITELYRRRLDHVELPNFIREKKLILSYLDFYVYAKNRILPYKEEDIEEDEEDIEIEEDEEDIEEDEIMSDVVFSDPEPGNLNFFDRLCFSENSKNQFGLFMNNVFRITGLNFFLNFIDTYVIDIFKVIMKGLFIGACLEAGLWLLPASPLTKLFYKQSVLLRSTSVDSYLDLFFNRNKPMFVGASLGAIFSLAKHPPLNVTCYCSKAINSFAAFFKKTTVANLANREHSQTDVQTLDFRI